MSIKFRSAQSFAYAALALGLLLTTLLPAFHSTAGAAQLNTRSIKISDSTPGATGVTYNITFTPVTSAGDLVVDFCANSPIVGDTCSFSAATAPTVTAATSAGTGATVGTTAPIHAVKITGLTMTAGTPFTVNLTNVTNPTTGNATYYARMYTYAAAGSSAFSAGTTSPATETTGSYVDYGGVALSTANAVTVTAKVQEQLTFCIYTGANCAAGGTAVALGNANGVLSSSNAYVDKTLKYDVATNASNGATVRMNGDTLKTGSFSIAAIGATAAASTPGSAQFGVCTTPTAGTTANFTPATRYNCVGSTAANSASLSAYNTTTATSGGSATFAYDTNATTGTLSTYGDSFGQQLAGASTTGTVAMIGNIPITQQAGVYTTTIDWVATGTY